MDNLFIELTKYIMSYFNYHGKAKKLIREKQLTSFYCQNNWNGIKPALILVFKNSKPMPIRKEKWQEYLTLIENYYSIN